MYLVFISNAYLKYLTEWPLAAVAQDLGTTSPVGVFPIKIDGRAHYPN